MGATKPGTESTVKMLLVGERNEDVIRLRDSLHHSANGDLHLDCVCSLEDARRQLGEARYDLVLCDGDDTALQGLRALVDDNSMLLIGPAADKRQIRAAIQELCSCPHDCSRVIPCKALAVLSAIDAHREEKQHQDAEQMLRKLRRTVEQSPDLVMIADCAGVLEYVNPAFEALTGYSREEVTGQTLGILKSEQQGGELYEEMWDTVLSGRTFHGVVLNRKKNGESFLLEKQITPLRNAAGQITHFISTGRDITDQRRLESALQQAQRMDAIGRLAGGVAHDFNNLLMVISANAELMLDSLAPDHALRQYVGEIITAARRAADLTRQLLAFGRKQIQSLQLLDLNAVVREISRMLPRLIGEDIQLALVPGLDLHKVKADPGQIEQVVMNLAANARDAMPRGGKLTIGTANMHLDEACVQRHSMVPAGDYVLLTVTDSGSGIPEEHLPHVFEPFFTTKEEGKGTGLGLATVYGIVKQNGGFVWVYSEPGLGTTFKIYWPRANSSGKEISVVPAKEESPHGSETLLLVEDEPAVRASSREFLTRSGYTVLEADNGKEALRVSREYCGVIDLMISDVVMPQMSGSVLAEQLSAERPGMKVLFVSGYAESTVLRHGKIDVAGHFLQKPFGLGDFARKVRQVLESAEPLVSAATSAT